MRSALRSVAVFGLVVGLHTGAFALDESSSQDTDKPYWRTNLFKRVATDQKFLLTTWWPAQFKDPVFASTLGVGFALVVQGGSSENGGWDRGLETSISESSRPGVKSAARGFTKLGNGPVFAAVLAVSYLSSRRAHDDQAARASSLAVESLINAGLWSEILKHATARVRPVGPESGEFFQYGANDNTSFPSGHAMAAFSVASVFAEVYRDHKWVPWFSHGIATLIGASRVSLGRHFPGDVVVGAVLGASIGRGMVARDEGFVRAPKGTVVPVVGPDGGVGIGWSYSWK